MSAKLCSGSPDNENCCLLCNKHLNPSEHSASADSTNSNAFTVEKVFQTFDKHLSVTVKGESFCWPNEGNYNPHFCTGCTESAEKLIRIDEEMEEIQKRLEEFINFFSLEILTAKGLSTFAYQIGKIKTKNDTAVDKQHNNELENSVEGPQSDSEYVVDTIKPEPEDIYECFGGDDFEDDSFHPPEEDTMDDPLTVNSNEAKHLAEVDILVTDKKEIKRRENEIKKLNDLSPSVKLMDIYKSAEKLSTGPSVETIQPTKRKSAEAAALRILRSSVKTENRSSDSECDDYENEHPLNKVDTFYGEDDGDSDRDEYQPTSDEDDGEMVSADNFSRKRKTRQSSNQSSKRATTSSTKKVYVQLRKTERGFYCSECDEKFSKTIELDQHSEKTGHVNEKTYKCEPCNKSYYRKVDLKYHTREHPPDMTNFTCGVCNLEFKTLGGFRKHCKSHRGKYFQCKNCVMKYLTKAALKEHQDTSHFSHDCEFCDKVYTGPEGSNRLKKHLKKHEKKKEKTVKKEDKKSFVCQVCEDDFTYSKDLEEHSESTGHKNEKNFFCSTCPKGFFRRCDLKDHQRTHNRKRRTYECELCTKIFKNSLALKNHVAGHEGVIFACKECDFASTNEKLFNEHMNYHTGETPFACSSCTSAFSTRRDLSNHRNVEHNEKRNEFECEFCGAHFFSENSLLTHTYVHTGIKPFNCDVPGCTSSFTSKGKLRIHFIKNHTDEKPFVCNQPNCEKAFKFKSSLEAHILMHIDPVAAKRYMCEHCGKGFAKAEVLRNHRKVHTSDVEKKFKCDDPLCGKLFQYKVSLSRHILKGHRDKQPPVKKGWPCAQCSYISPNASSYEKHLRSHTGEKPYMCEECGISYSSRGSLTVHMRKAHLGFRYGCSHCDKKFSSKRSMKDHQIIHKREQKTFKCSICKQEFPDKQELTTHQKSSHSNLEKRLKCSHCDARFTKGTNLKIHLKNVHGLVSKPPNQSAL